MEPQAPNQPDPHVKVPNTLSVTQSGEQTMFNIRRHPIGILGMYTAGGILLIVSAILCFLVPQHLNSSTGTDFTKIGALVFVLVLVVTVIFLLISTKVYWGNQWILTTDSITQVTQTSLFNRQSSQLSLGNLEDVTAEQNGILTHMFNYGLIKVETAGERSKFSFAYCPNPNYYAQQILSAREAFEQGLVEREGYAQTTRLPAVPYQEDTVSQGVNVNTNGSDPTNPAPPIPPPITPA